MNMTISKVENRPDVAEHSPVEVGKEYTGVADKLPVVGECFYLVWGVAQHTFRTSTVEEILPNNQFRTRNSVYQYRVN